MVKRKRRHKARAASRASVATLTPKRERFVQEYLIDLNATQAAIRAGYSRRTAEQQGSRLLRYAQVAAAVRAGRQAQAARLQMTADEVLEELAVIARSDIGDVLDFGSEDGAPRFRPVNTITPRARRAISAVKVKRYVEGGGEDARTVEIVEFKLWSKDAALARLASHHGIDAPKKVALTDKDGKPLTVQLVQQIAQAADAEGAD